ncbi:MAG: response regulator, partial [Gammaproteobacteria bacterium]
MVTVIRDAAVNKKLLIVEDDEGLQSQMRWCFDEIDVEVAEDRDSALSLLRRTEPQVVTLDLGLPPDPGGATEGFKLLQDILALAPRTKVIVVTGREERDYAVKAVGMGACDFYQKPVDAEILNFVVNRAFRLFELEQKNDELEDRCSNTSIKG